jgi:hypothetical protein
MITLDIRIAPLALRDNRTSTDMALGAFCHNFTGQQGTTGIYAVDL